MNTTNLSEQHAIERCPEDLQRRLSARSKGLLEVVPIPKDDRNAMGVYNSNRGMIGRLRTRLKARATDCRSSYFAHDVQFLHRTLRDFLRDSAEVHEMFQTMLPPDFQSHRKLCKAYNRLLPAVPLCRCGCDAYFIHTAQPLDMNMAQHRPFDTVLWSLLKHAQYVWEIYGNPMLSVLQAAEDVVVQREKQWRQNKRTAFIALAVEFRLTGYVKYRLQDSPELLCPNRRPLLDHALQLDFLSDQVLSLDWNFELALAGLWSYFHCLPMIELLLSFGISPNAQWRGCKDTAWIRFLQETFIQCEESHGSGQWDRMEIAQIVILLLKHEANLDDMVQITEEKWIEPQGPPVDGVFPNGAHTESPARPGHYQRTPCLRPASEAIRRVFAARADEIIKAARAVQHSPGTHTEGQGLVLQCYCICMTQNESNQKNTSIVLRYSVCCRYLRVSKQVRRTAV